MAGYTGFTVGLVNNYFVYPFHSFLLQLLTTLYLS